VSVTAGTNHTLAISEYGHLWTCGRGRHGQLGHGTFHDEGPLQRVDTLVGCRIVSAAAGAAHSMALASDGSLFTWGSGQHGQLGHKRMKHAADAAHGLPVASAEPEKVADLDPEHLKPPSRVTAIASGSNHSMALTVGGALLVFGRNKAGCLGLGDDVSRWVPTKVTMNDENGQRPCSCRVVQVTAGGSHTIALVEEGGKLVVKAAGGNAYGQLGLGDTSPRMKFCTLKTLLSKNIVSVSSGNDHSGAVDSKGRLFLWGRGELGQLGLSDFRSHWTPEVLPGFCVVHPDRTLRRNRAPATSSS
jgi:alpha-tubulin suppressor-like RCC1 family protein